MDRYTELEAQFAEMRSVQEASDLFEAKIGALGFKYFDFISLSASQISNPKAAHRFYLTNYLDGEPWDFMPKSWPDGDAALTLSMQQTGPMDFVHLLHSVPQSPAVLMQRGLIKLWNISHAWLVPLHVRHYVQFATVYMIGGETSAFQASRTPIFCLASVMMNTLAALTPEKADTAGQPINLTPEERACLSAIARGLKNSEIASELGVTSHTVRYHLKKLFKKLGVANRAEAAVVGLRLGLGG